MRLTPKDKKVIQAFYEQTSAESKKLYTDGKVLDGLWMGGNAIAEWEGRKIYIPNHVEEYLSLRYGNWEVPAQNYNAGLHDGAIAEKGF